jgi:hypothetical protein
VKISLFSALEADLMIRFHPSATTNAITAGSRDAGRVLCCTLLYGDNSADPVRIETGILLKMACTWSSSRIALG